MPDPEDVIQNVKDVHVIALKEMMTCANNQRVNNLDDVRQAQGFLTILQAYYKEQMEVLKAIKEAGAIIDKKLKEYKGPKEESIEDL
jgi:ribosome-binding factor A